MSAPMLRGDEIQKTIERLSRRISERFPGSGLASVCGDLARLGAETDAVVEWISRPNRLFRAGVGTLILAFLAVLALACARLNVGHGDHDVLDLIQSAEAATNEIVLICAGVVFLFAMENRRKRGRVIRSVNALRSMAHIVDVHQLTKDPDGIIGRGPTTPSSPKRELAAYEMGRYLDYCSEMLSCVSKLGFLYIQGFDDPAANQAVNELDGLTNGISTKIWQKIMILRCEESRGE